jgi:ABC-type uncharacterized transport system auxiliary subunit
MSLPSRGRHALSLFLAAILLPACSQLLGGKSVIQQNRKFVVDDSIPLRVALPSSHRPYPYKVAVERFDVSRLYDRTQVIYRLSPEEIREDTHLRWANRPSDMITDAVEGYLRQSLLFKDVRQEFLEEPDYTLSGTVKAIERIDSGDQWYAKLTMTMQLTDKNREVIWQDEFGFGEPVQVYHEDFVQSVAKMNQMLHGYMMQAVKGIDLQILLRKYRIENRPIEQIDQLLAEYENGSTATASSDSTAPRLLVPHPHYEIIPGKPTP